jgi:hypothetical protein
MKQKIVTAAVATAVISVREDKYVGTEIGTLLIEALAKTNLSEEQIKERVGTLLADASPSE